MLILIDKRQRDNYLHFLISRLYLFFEKVTSILNICSKKILTTKIEVYKDNPKCISIITRFNRPRLQTKTSIFIMLLSPIFQQCICLHHQINTPVCQ